MARDSVDVGRTVNAALEGEVGAPIGSDDVLRLLGPRWVGALTAFQLRDIAKLLSMQHGANFSVPGAGKTRVALAVFQALREAGRVERLLIVGPKSAYEAWQFENVQVFADPLKMEVFGKSLNLGANALIVNYERLDGATKALASWIVAAPTLLVLDEAHRMKLGSGGVYGAACLALGPRAKSRLILTGTPAPNGAKDLENLLGFVWPGQGRQAVVRAVAGGDLAQASRVLRPLFTRTTKDELGLRKPITTIRYVDLPPLHREIYDALTGQFAASMAPDANLEALGKVIMYLLMAAISPALLAAGGSRFEPLAYRVPPLEIPPGSNLLALMRDLPSYEMSPKYLEALAIVRQNADKGRKTIVWSTFVRSITTLQEMFRQFSPAVVHGGTKEREEEIRRFREDSDCMLLISNPATLGEGISLHQTSHDAIYVDRDFAAGRFLQSVDRIHRLGLSPETETRVTVLAASGTIDGVVAQRLETKLDFMGRILDDPSLQELADLPEEPVVGEGLDFDDIQALIGHVRGHTA